MSEGVMMACEMGERKSLKVLDNNIIMHSNEVRDEKSN